MVTRRTLPEKPLKNDPFERAQQLGIKVWSLTRLTDVIRLISTFPSTPKNLADRLKAESLFGVGKHDKIQPLAGIFLFVQEETEQYKPIFAKNIKNPPVLHFSNPPGRCAFLAHEHVVSSSSGDQLESVAVEEEKNSNASGIISTSRVPEPQKNKEYERVMHDLSKRVHVQKRRMSSTHQQRKKQKVQRINGKTFYNRPGYCENCNVKYEQFQQHIMTKTHRRWAENERNFQELDKCIQQVSQKS